MASRRDAKPFRHRFVPVWDVVVRLLHWTLAALVTVDLVRDDGDRLHRIVGYAAVAVVFVRLGWAAVSRSHGSFANLRPSVSASLAYVRLIVRGQARRPLGHNPLGLWMAWLLWTLVLMLGLSGWMTRLDAFWGDERVHDFHALLADMLLVAAILHLVGVATMSLLWKENLPASMVTGFKRADKANVD